MDRSGGFYSEWLLHFPVMLTLNREEVERLLPMGECIEVMAEALSALARGEALQPLRQAHWLPDRHGLLGVMPGALWDGDGGTVLGIKVITVFPGNHERGEESHLGSVLLFEGEMGKPLASLDAAAVTEIRTAAASGLATRLLAREDAGDLALLGSGVQARSHLAAMKEVRPLRRVRVWSRHPENARRFAAEESERHGLSIETAATAREAVEGADLVCTVTSAREPVVEGAWLAPGTHVNAAGACTPATRELDTEAVRRARVFVDRRESALAEAGDLLIPIREGALAEDHIAGELGDLLLGRLPGRQSPDEITLFESLGIAIEDVAAARHVWRKAAR
ncbi:MAG TPA: ornithine cyclodeaminase family protein [Thermoanaerobaculia bacterium]|nr:ornithine cyclodeaminase family protein [Thermoanaerobaculia bacterium]